MPILPLNRIAIDLQHNLPTICWDDYHHNIFDKPSSLRGECTRAIAEMCPWLRWWWEPTPRNPRPNYHLTVWRRTRTTWEVDIHQEIDGDNGYPILEGHDLVATQHKLPQALANIVLDQLQLLDHVPSGLGGVAYPPQHKARTEPTRPSNRGSPPTLSGTPHHYPKPSNL